MFRIVYLQILVIVCLVATSQKMYAQDSKQEVYCHKTDTVFSWIMNEQFDSVFANFSEDMQRQLSIESMDNMWVSMGMSMGDLVDNKPTMVEYSNGYWIADKPLKFERASMIFKLTFDSAGLIQGMFFVPQTQAYQIPSYVDGSRFIEYKLKFGKEPYVLEGTLSLPKGDGPFPVMILVHGSGPSDRDGTVGANKILKDIAWGLASDGIAVFRYDKRTFTYGMYMMGTGDAKKMTVVEETVEDAILALRMLSKQPKIDTKQMWIGGHSQGGMMAPEIARRSKGVKGIVMLAANARPIAEMMIEQLLYLDSLGNDTSHASKQRYASQIRTVQNALKPNIPDNTPTDSLPFGSYPAYWNFMQSYDQIMVVKSLKNTRIFILQGDKDYQVRDTDYHIWRSALGAKADGILLKDINHLLMKESGVPSPISYTKRGNVDESVIMQIKRAVLQ